MVRTIFFIFSFVISLTIILLSNFISPNYLWWFILFGPLILIGIYDVFQNKHTILKNFPIIGHLRYMLESISPEIQQYFVERRTDGAPIDKNTRAMIYERAKNLGATHPFGTENNITEEGYEFIVQSLYPAAIPEEAPRVTIGGIECTQPYSAALYNISAMSFGSLSKNAVMAMNKGAKKGNFYHNTGEGGLSPYHLQGGDICWQIGTGYFGCRNEDGTFSEENFIANATKPEVKLIEVKLSQGAKPGHGGVLPGVKNTPEIAAIRGIKPHITVLSPPGHSSFNSPKGLLEFIQRLRKVSGGKPTGFKLCMGSPAEFEAICVAMAETKIYPDFISVDGAEGGTGAAPLEFTNFVGLPLDVGLVLVDELLKKYGVREQVKINATGKVFSGFGLIKSLALGADLCCSARGMMLAVGCIHAQVCNTNTCPTGVATQNSKLMKGLNVPDKAERVYNFQKNTIHAFVELMAATGAKSPSEIKRSSVMRIAEDGDVHTMDEIINHWNIKKKVIDNIPITTNLGNGNF
ncbi:FMN-binding glutamate synthase family protein [Putridiphycobacter roseus]|uniref:FMN-binding glutamate synthase family protein n=1 Tax=Putridiphycobacter roseus TaxID=2219161 RepID=A0A2W1NQQ0_9FLAO|nr:FMN-binding glutamate synthase family protein [Putridiphycobacter roseus]PZE16988.1 FMN-binding glutamate synthase family protein [Putridiphycobacter roseus]